MIIVYLLLQQKEYKNNLLKSNYILDSSSNFEKQWINMNIIMKSYPSVSSNHPLRNPVVNILPKILPATVNPKISTTDKTNNFTMKKNSKPIDDNGEKRIIDNNIQTVGMVTEISKSNKNLHSIKTVTIDAKVMEMDKLSNEQKNNTKLSNISAESSKISKDTSQNMSGLPQIRKTTPRLAKTRSAQNMKLMAQVLSSKSLANCNTLKSKEKDTTDKNNDEHCTVSKVVSSILLH